MKLSITKIKKLIFMLKSKKMKGTTIEKEQPQTFPQSFREEKNIYTNNEVAHTQNYNSTRAINWSWLYNTILFRFASI